MVRKALHLTTITVLQLIFSLLSRQVIPNKSYAKRICVSFSTVSISMYTHDVLLYSPFYYFFCKRWLWQCVKNLFVSHYDCTKKEDNRINSLNEVADCKITPENLYVTPAAITLHQKNYGTDLSATTCSVKANVFRHNCGMISHSSYVHTQKSIRYDLIVTPEMCRQASKTNKIGGPCEAKLCWSATGMMPQSSKGQFFNWGMR